MRRASLERALKMGGAASSSSPQTTCCNIIKRRKTRRPASRRLAAINGRPRLGRGPVRRQVDLVQLPLHAGDARAHHVAARETDVERSGWIQRLLECGAQYHPLSSHLAAHAVQAQAPTAEAPPPPPIAAAQVRTNAGSTSTYVSVPVGARGPALPGPSAHGTRATAENALSACMHSFLAHTFSLSFLPQGERFAVTVPEGAGEQIEVIVPARCLNASSSSSSSSLQAQPPRQSLSRRSSADLVSDHLLLQVPTRPLLARSPGRYAGGLTSTCTSQKAGRSVWRSRRHARAISP